MNYLFSLLKDPEHMRLLVQEYLIFDFDYIICAYGCFSCINHLCKNGSGLVNGSLWPGNAVTTRVHLLI